MVSENRKKQKKKKATVEINECVACGTCANVCPISAINIVAGVFAEVDQSRCLGCGKCERACPASVISLTNLEEVAIYEKAKEVV
jgi:heterodisulfide reductase subunit A-like polyferredoxin